MKCKCGCQKEIPEKSWHKYYRHDFLKGHRISKRVIHVRCSNCNIEFNKRINSSTINHFCSKKCCGEHKKRNNIKICHQCKISFHRQGRRKSKSGMIFCSQKCTRIFFSGTNHPLYNGKIKKICPFCNKQFYVPPHNNDKIFCEDICYWQSMIINIDCRRHKIYSLKQWKDIVKYILERDNNECHACHKTYDLTVHHKEPYRISHNNSPANLITLCRSCHTKEESLYRKLESQRQNRS